MLVLLCFQFLSSQFFLLVCDKSLYCVCVLGVVYVFIINADI